MELLEPPASTAHQNVENVAERRIDKKRPAPRGDAAPPALALAQKSPPALEASAVMMGHSVTSRCCCQKPERRSGDLPCRRSERRGLGA